MKKVMLFFISLSIFGCTFENINSSVTINSNSSMVSSVNSLIFICSSTSSTFVSSNDNESSNSLVNSISSGSNKLSNTSTSMSNNEFSSIEKIKEIANNYRGLENSVGVYESNYEVNIDLKLLACLDAITTKEGYGDRYKILMSDGKDYIYLKTNFNNYDYLKKYIENKGVYRIKGTISLYNDEVELTVSEKPTYLENKDIVIDYKIIGASSSLDNIYQDINSLKLNGKGIAFSKIVACKVQCLAKDINNTNLYFGADDYIINVHGSDKVTNKFVQGTSYLLYGALSMHNFRPGLEYVYAEKVEEEDISFSIENISSMKALDFYNYKYEVDKNSTYPSYSKLFEKPYKVTGYLNSYMNNNKEYLVFEDNYNSNYYSKYQNASDAKSIFFVNENYKELTNDNIKYCPIYEHLELGSKLEVIVFPYLWNTQKYPQVYCYNFDVL